MKNKSVNQRNNRAGGDIVAGDKIVEIKKEITSASQPIRSELSFELSIDKENTTLMKKLIDGEVNPFMRKKAAQRKVKSLKLLIDMCKTDSGKKIVADIYENLITMIENKYLINMNEGDLLKTNMEQIHEDFSDVIKKFNELLEIDEPFLTGLLYIATSNCAINWSLEGEVS